MPTLDCHEEGPPLVTRSGCHRGASSKEARLQCCTPDWISAEGRSTSVCSLVMESIWPARVPPDVDSLRTLAHRIAELHGQPVCAVVESMTGARLVHDTLEQEAGRSRSPTPRRSRAWPRSPARPTRSTRESSAPSPPSATSRSRCTQSTPRCRTSRLGPLDCLWPKRSRDVQTRDLARQDGCR